MANTQIPVRAPERQPEPSASRPVGWREKKPSRFVIKVGGVIPT